MQPYEKTLLLTGLSLSLAACRSEPGPSPRESAPAVTVSVAAREPVVAAVEPGPVAQLPAPAEPAPQHPLTLDEAIARALDANPDLMVTFARIAAAEANLSEARGAFRPYLGVEAEYLVADAPSSYLFKTIDAGALAPGTDFNDPGSFNNLELGLTLRWNLYNGGRDLARRDMSEHELGIRSLEAAAMRNALVSSVVATWYDVRAAEDQHRTAQVSAETVRAQLAETRARFEVGVLLESDVLSLEVRLAEAQELVIRAANARELGIAALSNLLGIAGDQRLELAPMDPPAVELPQNFPLALEAAMRQRPELERARRVVGRAERGVDEAQASYLPRADLFARLYGDSVDELEFQRGNWVAGVALTWDVYAGGTRGAGVDRARASLHEMMEADRAAALAVQLDVRRAWLRREEAHARLAVAGAAVGQADQSLRLVREQYEGGTATVTRYLEAELMATQARMRQTQAAFDSRRSDAEVERAIGRHRGVVAEEGS